MAATCFRFGAFELDLERYELFRDGDPIAVEPRVLDLLAYLVRQRGRVLSKDELVAQVWEGEAVSDSALARAVSQARRTLDESAAEPFWIETVHGRGYRFRNEVQIVESPGRRFDDGAPAASGDESGPGPGRRHLWSLTAALTAVAVVAVLSLIALAEHERGTEQAPPSMTTTDGTAAVEEPGAVPLPTVALHGFRAPEDDRELQLVGLSLLDLLGAHLEAVDGLAVRKTTSTGPPETPETRAERLGARYVVSGELARNSLAGDANDVDLSLTLYESLGDGRSLGTPLGRYAIPSLETPSDLARYVQVRNHISERLFELLLPALEGRPQTDVAVPRDPVAYRYYLLGYGRLLEDFCAGGAAEALLQRSVDIDPRFAPAWLYLGVSRYNQVWACGGDAAHYDRALAAFDRAAAIDPDDLLARTNRIALLVETGRVEEAYETVLEERRNHPDAPTLLNAELYALRYAGFLDASHAALERLLDLDPLAFAKGAIGGSPTTYLYLGRLDDFLAELPPLEMPYFAYYRGYVDLVRGDREGARQAAATALHATPGGIFGQLCSAVTALAEDDPETAVDLVAAVSRHRRELGHGDGEITYKQAQLLALAGARDRALEELARTVDDGFFCVRCFETDPALTSIRDTPGFEEVLSRARRRHESFGRRFGLDDPTIQD